MSPAEWIGSLGVALLLVAFALQLAGVLGRASGLYSALNALGAGLACWASWQIGFLPFVLLEGLWCLVALAALLRGR
jgi:hypothetical protein